MRSSAPIIHERPAAYKTGYGEIRTIAADVPAPLTSIPGLPSIAYDIAGKPSFPPGVFIVTSAAEWKDLWSRAAAYAGRFMGAVPRDPAPGLPDVDFARQSLVVVTDSLYPGEEGPILTRLMPSLEVVKPNTARYVSHLDFYQSVSAYIVPKLAKDTPIHATCSDGVSCPAPSPSGF